MLKSKEYCQILTTATGTEPPAGLSGTQKMDGLFMHGGSDLNAPKIEAGAGRLSPPTRHSLRLSAPSGYNLTVPHAHAAFSLLLLRLKPESGPLERAEA